MTALNKVIVIGLSIAVFMCLLYGVKLSSKKNVSNIEAGTEDDGLESKLTASLTNDMLTLTKEGPETTFASSIQVVPQHTLSSSATSSRPPTTEHTKPTPPPPHNILYLIQTEQCIPPYFQLNDVFGIPNSGFEVIVLSYKEACLDSSMPHVQYLLDNRTTWTTGRNVLFEAAMNRNQKYLYYVFMDDDFALGDPRHQLMGPWRRFESSLRSYEPAIAAIDHGWVPRIRDFHAERQCSGEAAEFIGTVWFDAICNAFHYKAIRHILPYDPTFDQQTWWASQMSVIIRSEVLFRGQVVLHAELFGDNTKHRPYPRDFNFTPDMLHHMTKDLDTLVPTFCARCANVTIQQWRTMKPMEHGSSSPTLCLPSAPYHDTITPGRYSCT